MDYSVLEQHKENIQPHVHGRLATAIAKNLHDSGSVSEARNFHENRLKTAPDLDDPLQVYLDYLKWTAARYPQGATAESGLLPLLEKCTSVFRDDPFYKNDPRYLKIWLQYASFAESPRDIFVYLARKGIGSGLALYYEEFAKFLEAMGNVNDANEVYEIGIERRARPLDRLRRSHDAYNQRVSILLRENRPSSIRQALATVQGSPLGDTTVAEPSASPLAKRQKLHVHADPTSVSIRDSVFGAHDGRPIIHPLRQKENVIAPKPWAGELIQQKHSEGKPPAPKIQVFRDPLPLEPTPTKEYSVVNLPDGSWVTLTSQPNKPSEQLMVNLDLLYPTSTEEYSLVELAMMSLRMAQHRARDRDRDRDRDRFREDTTMTIPLKDDTTGRVRPASPTLTQFSRATANEVVGMFNDAAHLLFEHSTRDEDPTSTNYDGFVTETIEHRTEPSTPPPQTPPTDHYDSGSSPFVP